MLQQMNVPPPRSMDLIAFLGNPSSCPMRHTGYCIAGRLVVRMVETSVKTNIDPGDFFEIPAGHDAYVERDESVELVLFASPDHPD